MSKAKSGGGPSMNVIQTLINALQQGQRLSEDDVLLGQLRADAHKGDPAIARSSLSSPAPTADEIVGQLAEWDRQAKRRKEEEERAFEAKHPAPYAMEGARRGKEP